jgi:adenine-specific DNA-methyltransferase
MKKIIKKKKTKLTVLQSLRKGHRKQKTTRKEMDLFRQGLKRMFECANKSESEEYHKGLIKEFLNSTSFSQYFINTKDRSDLVIHTGNTPQSEVGVIIEVKRPTNTNEMPTIENLNKKGLHELFLYFLRERFTNSNINLKHLIITNLFEWFIFDASEFEKISEITKIKKNFADFEEGLLLSVKTNHFYSEIASPLFEQTKDNILFTHFNINDYKKHVVNHTEESLKALTELQKLLSPVHLLKLPFANDSNTLNKEFYCELLHIIGLEEYAEKNKKLIRRKPAKYRDEDSLIESTIAQLRALGKLNRIRSISDYGHNEEEQLYSIALELVITWVNRTLFLKLLESQIVLYNQSSKKNYTFFNKDNIKGYDDLNTIFFEVLAVPTNNRREALKRKYPNVPYLNSSLFEPTTLEHETILISNLPDCTEIDYYKRTVINSKVAKANTLEYFIQFLDSYDFASDAKEDVIEDNKSLINASVLGLIFEKINGYKDGSFFTPGFITMYMCREVIREKVVKKFQELTEFDGEDFDDLTNFTRDTYKVKDLKKYNEVVNSLKLCDPAVGSGHFLVSALNEIICVKSDLGILSDEKGFKLCDYELGVENDELMILDSRGDFFKYSPDSRESQRIQKTIFHEKQTIIENCLFGVDININSVKICRLRLWIELLKNAYYNETGELETLPNIDINIKCGNSIVSRYPLSSDIKEVLRESEYTIDCYRKAVMTYRNASNKEQKIEMVKLIEDIKNSFTEWIDSRHPLKKKLLKLKGELSSLVDQRELFQTESKSSKLRKIKQITNEIKRKESEIDNLRIGKDYKNAFEWRFEFPEVLDDETGDFLGFDIIIGNPPYGLFNKKLNQRIALSISKTALQILKQDFPYAASGSVNAYKIFYNLGLNLSNKSGYQTMIVPFGILTDTTSENLRKYIFNNHSFIKIDAFPERDSAAKRVFEDVKMSTAILITCKDKISDQLNLGISYNRKIENKDRIIIKYSDIFRISPELCAIPITKPSAYEVLSKLYSKKKLIRLGAITKCLTGEADMSFAKNAMTQNSKDALLIKGVQIDRYLTKLDSESISQGIIEYLNVKKFRESYDGKKIKDAYKRRLVLQGLTGVNEKFRLKATIIEPPAFLANSCNYLLENESASLYFLLGLINSKLLNFIFKCKSTNSNVNGYEVDALPLPKTISDSDRLKIEILANQILDSKRKTPDMLTSKLEAQIDEKVYEIYDITDKDIAIIESGDI